MNRSSSCNLPKAGTPHLEEKRCLSEASLTALIQTDSLPENNPTGESLQQDQSLTTDPLLPEDKGEDTEESWSVWNYIPSISWMMGTKNNG